MVKSKNCYLISLHLDSDQKRENLENNKRSCFMHFNLKTHLCFKKYII